MRFSTQTFLLLGALALALAGTGGAAPVPAPSDSAVAAMPAFEGTLAAAAAGGAKSWQDAFDGLAHPNARSVSAAPSFVDAQRRCAVHAALEESAQGIDEASKRERFAKMAAFEFAFFRGSNAIFWHDIADHPLLREFGGSALTATNLGGDQHVVNFGIISNRDLRAVYNTNDFDESVVADYQYDVMRAAASIIIILRANEGMSKLFGGRSPPSGEYKTAADIAVKFVDEYLDALMHFEGESDNRWKGKERDPNKVEFDVDNSLIADKVLAELKEYDEHRPAYWLKKQLQKYCSKDRSTSFFGSARDYDRIQKLSFRSIDTGDGSKFRRVGQKDWQRVERLFRAAHTPRTRAGWCADVTVVDIVRRVSQGTGSNGVQRFYLLINDPENGDEWKSGTFKGSDKEESGYVILDMKEQGAPTPARFLLSQEMHAVATADHSAQARRVAEAYDAMTPNTSPFAGWTDVDTSDGRAYSVAMRSPYKFTYPVWMSPEEDRSKLEPTSTGDWVDIVRAYGAMLATAHSRTDPRNAATRTSLATRLVGAGGPLASAAARDEFISQMALWGVAYANQVEADYKAWANTASGRGCKAGSPAATERALCDLGCGRGAGSRTKVPPFAPHACVNACTRFVNALLPKRAASLPAAQHLRDARSCDCPTRDNAGGTRVRACNAGCARATAIVGGGRTACKRLCSSSFSQKGQVTTCTRWCESTVP